MKRIVLVLGVAVLGLAGQGLGAEVEWERIDRANKGMSCVLVEPDNPKVIYAGSEGAILKTQDGGVNWRSVLFIKGDNRKVNFLAFGPESRNSVYAATGNGFFYTSNSGRNWSRIFRGKSYLENECTVLAVLPDAVYLGTGCGLFVSKDKGRSWHKATGKLGKSRVLAIASNLKEPDYLYVASVSGVFRSNNQGQSWEGVFFNPGVESENGNDAEEVSEDIDEKEKTSDIRYISCDPEHPGYVYLATSRGVYASTDRGKSWDLLSDYGLLDKEVNFLSVSADSALYVNTKRSIFKYAKERWEEESFALVSEDIRSFALDKKGLIYAACDKGLFRSKMSNNVREYKGGDLLTFYSRGEPSIDQVQKAAIKYAEVESRKIKLWRRQAAVKAWFPKVSAGVGRNTGDLWHWESGSTTKTGDDVLIKGNDALDWDVNLSWDLGEVIWNSDQTSIDVRSRLLVELRDDILDEVNKTYFERLRVKAELDSLSIEERKKRFEKELKLEELTASLDALTAGYFSEWVSKNRA